MANTYVPFRGRTDQCQSSFPAMVSPAGLISDHGSPEGVKFGNPGQRYRDLDNDDLYVKFSGTQETGWRRVGVYNEASGSGSSSGSSNILTSAVDPTGVVATSGAAICLGSGAMEGKVWVKSTSTNTADDWALLIG